MIKLKLENDKINVSYCGMLLNNKKYKVRALYGIVILPAVVSEEMFPLDEYGSSLAYTRSGPDPSPSNVLSFVEFFSRDRHS